ncbi:MAG: PPC domain-containing protein [Candidatus Sulfotelmatobacter sp.]
MRFGSAPWLFNFQYSNRSKGVKEADMQQSVKSLALFVATMCGVGITQDASTQASEPPPTSPVAYVYVSNGTSSSSYKINGYSAASNGALTAVPGSPISTNNISYMALNGKWLFGDNGTDIYSFSIASSGALKQVSSIDAEKYNSGNTGGPAYLFLDHSGATLYDFDIYGDGTGNNEYQSFDIDQDTGVLSYTGTTPPSAYFETPLSFIGNNVDAYGASCYHGFQSIYGFTRGGSGTLTKLNINPPIPAAPKGSVYCPYLAAADPTNHVAVTLTPTNDGLSVTGPTQLAVYTASGTGNLTTSSGCEHATNQGGQCQRHLDVARRQPAGCRWREGTAGVPLQRGEADYHVHRTAHHRRCDSDVLG